jgi:hypothetical protein
LSIYIPQISVDSKGDLIPNPGENTISMFKFVEHDEQNGNFYVTNSRLVWIGTKESFLGRIIKGAVLVALGAGSAVLSRGRSGMEELGMERIVSKNQQGQPQTVSLPYEVMKDDPVWNDEDEFVVETQAGSLMFKFEHAEDADDVAVKVKEEIREAERRSSNLSPQGQQSPDYRQTPPPQYVPPPQTSDGYNFCPHCGTPLEARAHYCHNCGERLH